MSLINISILTKEKEGSSGSGSGITSSQNVTNITNISAATTADRLAEAVTIWGNSFDGSDDVEGDLTINQHNLLVYGDAKFSSYNWQGSYTEFEPSLQAGQNSTLSLQYTDLLGLGGKLQLKSDEGATITLNPGEEISFMQNGNTTTINGKGISFDFDATIQAEDSGSLAVKADDVYVDSIHANDTNDINIYDNLILNHDLSLNGYNLTDVNRLYSNYITNYKEIVTQDLTVTGLAHFFNLVIDEVQHAGGQMILSAANYTIDDIDTYTHQASVENSKYRNVVGTTNVNYFNVLNLWQICYDEETGEEIQNKWQKGDHLFSTSTNSLNGSFDHRASWTLVTDAEHDVQHYINGVSQRCNRLEVVVSAVKSDGSVAYPVYGEVTLQTGDSCALLGSFNTDRQAAIVFAAYKSFDTDLAAPLIAQYEGINDFSLTGKATTYFSKEKNRIQGDLVVTGGSSVEDLIDQMMKGNTPYVHVAYSNSADGNPFVLAEDMEDGSTYLYMGLCSNFSADASDLTYTDFTWSRINSEDSPVLYPVRERLYLNSSDNLILDLSYYTSEWSSDFLSTAYSITAVVSSANAALSLSVATKNSESGTQEYLGTVQTTWSQLDADERYTTAVITLADADGNTLDQNTISISMDPGAVLSITDTITARVSNAEKNINTLTLTAEELKNTISDSDGNYSELKNTVDGLTSTVASVKETADGNVTKISTLQNTVDGLTSTVSEVKETADGNVTKISTLQNTVDGLSTTVTSVETSLEGYTTKEEFSALKQTVDGFDFTVEDKVLGGVQLLDGTDFGNQDESLMTGSWTFGAAVPTVCAPSADSPTANRGYLQLTTDSTTTWDVSDSELTVMSQKLSGELKPATWFTLSFYSQDFPAAGGVMKTYIYPNVGDTTSYPVVNGETSTTALPADCNHDWTYSDVYPITNNGWRKYVYTFKTSSAITQDADYYLLFRLVKPSGDTYPTFYLSMPRLEEGQVAMDYDSSPADKSAQMVLTAEEFDVQIRSDLRTTGINVTDGQITLSAENTLIDGTLNITDAGTGIVMLDDSGLPAVNICQESIGDLEDIEVSGYASQTKSLVSTYRGTGSTYSKTISIDLCEVVSGDVITFRTASADNVFSLARILHYYNTSNEYLTTYYLKQDCTISYALSVAGTQVASASYDKSYAAGGYDFQIAISPITVSAAGTLSISITYSETADQHSSNVAWINNYIGSSTVNWTFELSALVGYIRNVSYIAKLGTDGLFLASGVDKHFYYGPSGIEMMFGSGSYYSGLQFGQKIKALYHTDNSGKAAGQIWGSLDGAPCGNQFNLTSTSGWTTMAASSCPYACQQINSSATWYIYEASPDENCITINITTGTMTDKYIAIVLPTVIGESDGSYIHMPVGKRYFITDLLYSASTQRDYNLFVVTNTPGSNSTMYDRTRNDVVAFNLGGRQLEVIFTGDLKYQEICPTDSNSKNVYKTS